MANSPIVPTENMFSNNASRFYGQLSLDKTVSLIRGKHCIISTLFIFSADELRNWIDRSLGGAGINDEELCSLIRGCLSFDPRERLRKEALLEHAFFREVIPVVGTTGTGKSTLISLMSGQQLVSGAGSASVTRDCPQKKGCTSGLSWFSAYNGMGLT